MLSIYPACFFKEDNGYSVIFPDLNQNRYIVDRYKEFAAFVRKKTEGGFHITKDAGVFIARK